MTERTVIALLCTCGGILISPLVFLVLYAISLRFELDGHTIGLVIGNMVVAGVICLAGGVIMVPEHKKPRGA